MNARVLGGSGGGGGGGETTVVLAHGYGGSSHIWDDVAPALAKKFRVVVFDWSFSGDVVVDDDAAAAAISEDTSCSYFGFADELVAMMDELALTEVVFVGHSMAGMIGCIASVARPELFRRLVLVGASPRFSIEHSHFIALIDLSSSSNHGYINDDGDGYVGGFERSEVDAMLAAIEADFAAWAPLFAEAVVGPAPSPAPGAAVAKFAKQLGRMRPAAALRVMRAVLTCDVRAVLRDVASPCTIVHCARDAVAPLAVARYMQREMARGVGGAPPAPAVVVMESSGHFPQLTAPMEFVRVMEAILLDN
uniref:AB hydrolase-1 domain-containing protein n=1 Tax=Oryza meridionalis TaxID=40149 RepID=A0A0E0DMT1_9ORYZ